MANNNARKNSSSPTPLSTKSPFTSIQQAEAKAVVEGGGFDVATAADIGVKVLVAAAAGTIIYNQFAGDKAGK